MGIFRNLFLNKEERFQTKYIMTISFGDSEDYFLLSRREKDGLEEIYLFNRIKIFQKKLKVQQRKIGL